MGPNFLCFLGNESNGLEIPKIAISIEPEFPQRQPVNDAQAIQIGIFNVGFPSAIGALKNFSHTGICSKSASIGSVPVFELNVIG